MFDKSNIDNDFHRKNILETFPCCKMEITEYDKKVYKLEKKMGEYEVKLNSSGIDLQRAQQ